MILFSAPMLYIIGGTSRSGKTLLARRAVTEKGIPYFPLDGIFNILAECIPERGVTYEQSLLERPKKMWPITKQLLKYLLKEERDYLVEGDALLPSQVNELVTEGMSVSAIFLGYTRLTRNEKLALIRLHHQGEIDWTKDINDTHMLSMIDEMIQFSSYIRKECNAYGIKYFDISDNFQEEHDTAFAHLFKKE